MLSARRTLELLGSEGGFGTILPGFSKQGMREVLSLPCSGHGYRNPSFRTLCGSGGNCKRLIHGFTSAPYGSASSSWLDWETCAGCGSLDGRFVYRRLAPWGHRQRSGPASWYPVAGQALGSAGVPHNHASNGGLTGPCRRR